MTGPTLGWCLKGVKLLFAHDTEMSLSALAALVNTGRGRAEGLAGMADLDAYATTWRWTGSRVRDDAELVAVRALRGRLEQLWTLDEDGAVLITLSATDGNGDALEAADGDYELFGTIGTGEIFTVLYESSVFSDVVLFIPNNVFANVPRGTQLSYQLAIIDLTDTDNLNFLYMSDPITVETS